MIHELKTWPKYFYRVFSGEKKFEVRKKDRDYQIGDHLKLMEYNPDCDGYTGREMNVRVTYILYGGDFGIDIDFCVMSIVIVG
jgi:hypothetical protein